MAFGKDIDSSDGLGGVHKVQEPRQAVPAYGAEQVDKPAVASESRTDERHMVADPDQIARIEHTEPAPIVARTRDHSPEPEEEAARTPKAPFQDSHVAPTTASAWEASPLEPKG